MIVLGLIFISGIALLLHFGKNERDLEEELDRELDNFSSDML